MDVTNFDTSKEVLVYHHKGKLDYYLNAINDTNLSPSSIKIQAVYGCLHQPQNNGTQREHRELKGHFPM